MNELFVSAIDKCALSKKYVISDARKNSKIDRSETCFRGQDVDLKIDLSLSDKEKESKICIYW